MIAKVLKWGNSYGVRLAKADVEREGIRVGDEVVFELRARPRRPVDVSHIRPLFRDGTLSQAHDKVEWA